MIVNQIRIKPGKETEYPFNLTIFKQEIILDVERPVTVFVGENGSGKSSLLKLIQSRMRLVEIKWQDNPEEKHAIDASTVDIMPKLGKPRGFFFESLKFINYMEYMQKEIAYSNAELERVDKEYKNRSPYAKMMAESPFKRTIGELDRMYSRDLPHSSHGEAYLDFFASRIRDNQIYLLDEPETPLSFQNQLTLAALIIQATKKGCQFIIATHSPIIAAIPEAFIYEIEENKFVRTNFDEIKDIQMLRQFLNHKEQFLRHLDEDD
ncbi:MAG TPA: AAA family ATPase [Bacillota bacterium]|nr:AAA family ATPase [Bacillota bacterium]HPF41972.1 AAA family ATPase [Bacillota bacterium]HPJ85954.1 AAA family ATPase [Bacillota bacterium]HPQ61848.1 AAA family ATPase [Bacillota bacterium]HRX91175.1 AAA family ATPase [Candidatus Izemoplasmatales bacterium]